MNLGSSRIMDLDPAAVPAFCAFETASQTIFFATVEHLEPGDTYKPNTQQIPNTNLTS
jgi:hypothetical protein